jgi:hypothetical protein
MPADKNLSEALMMKLEETKKLLSSSSSVPNARSRFPSSETHTSSPLPLHDKAAISRPKPSAPPESQVGVEKTGTTAIVVAGDAQMAAEARVERPIGIRRESVEVHTAAVVSALSSALPTLSNREGSELSPLSSVSSSLSSSSAESPLSTSMTLGTSLLVGAGSQVLSTSHPDLLLQRSRQSYGSSGSGAATSSLSVSMVSLSTGGSDEEEVDITCLGAKIRGELTERGAEMLKMEIDKHRVDGATTSPRILLFV